MLCRIAILVSSLDNTKQPQRNLVGIVSYVRVYDSESCQNKLYSSNFLII